MFNASYPPQNAGLLDDKKIMQLTFPATVAPEVLQAEAQPIALHANADVWQVRVDMTLADAEALVEGLRSLIAIAKDSLQEQHAVQPTALAWAGLKIGADTQASPARLPYAQWDALSRMPVRRSITPGPDGRLVHALTSPAKLQPQPARITG